MTIALLAAWVYARRSKLSTDQASVEDQIERGREACDEHDDWRFAGVLAEEVSASRYARKSRDAWPELLEKIAAGLVGVLILWQSSRGERKLSEWSEFLELCARHRTLIHVLSDERTYDPRKKGDWKVLASQGVDNDYFSRNLSTEITRGKRRAMGNGRAQGTPPYGYEAHYNPATGKTAGWKIVEDEAKVVREIIERVGKSHPIRPLADSLNSRAIPSPANATWTAKEVKHIAQNPSYCGLVRLSDGSYAARQEQKDGAKWPPIVTRAQWEAARAVLESRMTGPRPGAVRHLLSHLVHCECGGVLAANGQGAYTCRTGHLYVSEEWLDKIVRMVICERLSLPDARELFVADDGPEKMRLRSEVSELTERRSRFRRQAALGQITEDALLEIEKTLTPEIVAKESRLGSVSYVPAVAELVRAGEDGGVAAVEAAWDMMSLQARRVAIAAVTGITVRRVNRHATKASRYDIGRLAFDGKPQPPRLGPRGRVMVTTSTDNGAPQKSAKT